MSLYHIQDPDRPLYVVAGTYAQAVDGWRALATQENKDCDMTGEEPDGVALVCGDDDLLIWTGPHPIVPMPAPTPTPDGAE